MLKKKSDENQILLNNENKALINNLTDQIEFLKKGLRSKGTVIKLFIENLKSDNEYFQNKTNNDSNQTEKWITPNKTAKVKTTNKDHNNVVSPNHFESDKLRALRAHVPTSLRAYVLTCQRVLRV